MISRKAATSKRSSMRSMLPRPGRRVHSTCWLITSIRCELPSNAVLALVAPHLRAAGFSVEAGKRQSEKIRVPVLFGLSAAAALAYPRLLRFSRPRRVAVYAATVILVWVAGAAVAAVMLG